MQNLEQIIKDLQLRLSKHRFKHTQSVALTALEFAKAIDKNPQYSKQITPEYLRKIEIAAWLHDCCKELNSEEQLSLAEFYGIEIYEEDRISPNTLHARVGAAWAEEEYEIYDPHILNAVRDHTLGSPQMLTSSKILYLADMLEPGRDARDKSPELEELRQVLLEENDLDKALLMAMNSKIKHVIEKNHTIHPLSIIARNKLILKIETCSQSSQMQGLQVRETE